MSTVAAPTAASLRVAARVGGAPAFGDATFRVLRRGGLLSGAADLELATAAFGSAPDAAPTVALSRCLPTAAFSRRDTLLPGYPAAADAVRRHGFEPVVRPVGGHLAAYDEGSLVVHLWAPHPEPREHIRDRFAVVGEALADALRGLGAWDARVGPVPGEYCDGAWSVNLGGTRKVAGTGQRLGRGGFLFSAVVTVRGADALSAVLCDAYAALCIAFAPASVGSVAQAVPGVRVEDVGEAVASALLRATGRAGARGPSGRASRDTAAR